MITFGSLFSGIGGFDLGFEQANLTCAWQVEIDDKCNGVLAHHWPNVRRYEDVRTVGKHNLEPVSVISGGFPCQDVSVAGKRKGLAGERSGLWFEFHRVLEELRPQWVVIENVPGLLSGCGCTTCQAVRRIVKLHAWLRERKGGVKCPVCIAGERMLKSHSGRNFTIVLQGLAEIGYRSAWRILDAQYYGVAQRRRRVFIVGSLRNMAGLEQAESGRDLPGLAGLPAEVLFESESLSWGSAPCRQAGKGVAAPVKASSPSRRGGGSWPIAEEFVVQHALSGNNQRNDPDGEHFVVVASAGNLARGGCGAKPSSETAPTLRADMGDHHPIVFNWQSGGDVRLGISEEQVGALQANQTPAVLAMGVSENQRAELRLTPYSRQITTGGGKPGQGYPCVLVFSADRDGADAGEIVPTLRHGGSEPHHHNAYRKPAVVLPCGVRRLTPTECERLQGFPDGWTAVNGQKDSNRYRQLGNAVWVSGAKWIGRRIAEAAART